MSTNVLVIGENTFKKYYRFLCEGYEKREFDLYVIGPHFEQGLRNIFENKNIRYQAFDSIIAATHQKYVDLAFLKRKEDEWDANLMDAFVADRSLYYDTVKWKYIKYRPKEDFDSILRKMQACIEFIDALYNEFVFDVVIGDVKLNMMGYLIYQFAKNKPSIKIIRENLIRVGKVQGFANSPYDNYPDIENLFKNESFTEDNFPLAYGRARRFLEDYLRGTPQYEIPWREGYTGKGTTSSHRRNRLGITIRVLGNTARAVLKGRFESIGLEVKRNTRKLLSGALFDKVEFSRTEYAFFPLQSEPETALMIDGKAYLNQIELVRNTANNLPIYLLLVVKDHPNMYGVRSPGYYKKIKNIPRVKLLHPLTDTRRIIQHARVVIGIQGTPLLEALNYSVPVVAFGNSWFNVMKNVYYVSDPNNLSSVIRQALQKPVDQTELLKLYAAAFQVGYEIKDNIRFSTLDDAECLADNQDIQYGFKLIKELMDNGPLLQSYNKKQETEQK